MRYQIEVFAIDETGRKATLGNIEVSATNRAEANNKAINMLWDPRLSAASCKAKTRLLSSTKRASKVASALR